MKAEVNPYTPNPNPPNVQYFPFTQSYTHRGYKLKIK